jgi:putative addiction module CopG family antidote
VSIDLSPENERFVQDAVAQGTYHSRDEAINLAVAFLRRRDQLLREVNAGIEQVERGEVRPLDIDQIKAEIQQRLLEEGSRR